MQNEIQQRIAQPDLAAEVLFTSEPQRASARHDIPADLETLAERILSSSPAELSIAQDVARTIASLPINPEYGGVSPRALIVGGFVRSAALGQEAKDLDLEVYGVSAELLERTLQSIYPGRVNTVGRSFGILKVASPCGLELDISIPRRESRQGSGHRGFLIEGDPSLDIRQAAERRDFTWNAIAADPLTGEIVDHFGGIDDLREGVLRVTNPEKFQEDPLRVYRAAQFIARMSLRVEPGSFALMEHMVERGDLAELSRERVTEELEKLLLRSERPSVGLDLLKELGVLRRHFPELDVANLPHACWQKTMRTIDHAALTLRGGSVDLQPPQKLAVLLASLLHRTSLSEMDPRGSPLAATGAFLSRLIFGNEVDRAVHQLVLHRHGPSEIVRAHSRQELSSSLLDNRIRKLIRDAHPVKWPELRTLAKSIAASVTDRISPLVDWEAAESSVHRQNLHNQRPGALLQGRDLIALGLTPGHSFGKIVAEIELHRDRGRIETRDQALLFVRRRHLVTTNDLREHGIADAHSIGATMRELRAAVEAGEVSNRRSAIEWLKGVSGRNR